MTALQTPHDILREVDADYTDAALALLEEWDEWKYGVSPSGSAAAAYYAAGLLDANSLLTQDRVADQFDVSTVTIRQHYDDIIESAGGLPNAVEVVDDV